MYNKRKGNDTGKECRITMRDRFRRFMQGRYGVDHFSHFLVVVALILMVLQLFIRSSAAYLILNTLVVVIIVYAYFRIFSRNHYKRYAENEKYLQVHNRVKVFLATKKSHLLQRKTHRIFKCPGCGQSIRVPKGKGKIAITCPKCRTEFIKRS